MAKATAAAVEVTAEHEGAQLKLAVPPGTEIDQVWHQVAGLLEIPEDVEVYPRNHVDRNKYGLRWDSQIDHPVHLVFAEYAYA